MSTGRPREEAPEGYVTMREASELLGIPYTTLRYRVLKRRIEAHEETTPGGEPRYYIHENVIRRELERTTEVATTADLEEVEISLEGEVETNRQVIEHAVNQLVTAITGISQTLEAQSEHFEPLVKEILSRLNRLERIEHANAEVRSNSADLLELQKELIRLQRDKAESDRAHQQMIAEQMRREEEHRQRVEERLAAMEASQPQSRAWWRRWFCFSAI